MTAVGEPDVVTPVAGQEPKSSAAARIAAGVGGLVVLIGATFVSAGTGLIALIAMAVVGAVQRSRGRAVTRMGHWVTACATIAVVFLALGGAVVGFLPKGSLHNAKQAMDSSNVAAAKQPPPAWVQKLYPQYAQQAANTKPPSTAMVWVSMIIGVGMAVSFFSAFLGTLSWGAGMLLGLAVTGRWPGAPGESFENLAVRVA